MASVLQLDLPKTRRSPELLGAAVVGLLILLLAYMPTVLARYAWNDDYQVFEHSRTEPLQNAGLFQKQLGDGRVVGAYLVIAFRLVPDPYTLWPLKTLSFLGVVALFLMVWAYIAPKSRHVGYVAAAGLAATFLLPSWHVFVAYAALWPGPLLAALCLGGTLLMSRPSPLRLLLAIALQIPCWSSFPLLALLPIGFILTVAMAKKQASAILARNLSRTLAVLLASFVATVLLTRLAQSVFNSSVSERVALTGPGDIGTKAGFFVSRIVVTSFRPFFVDSPLPWIAAATAAPFMLLLLWVVLRQARALAESPLLRLGLVGATIMLTASPMLLWQENVIDWRLTTVITWTSLAGTYMGLCSLLENSDSRPLTVAPLVVLAVASGALVIAGLSSSISILTGIYKKPFDTSQTMLANALRSCAVSGQFASVQVLPAVEYLRTNRLGDFSLPTDLALPWAAQWAVQAAVQHGLVPDFPSSTPVSSLSADAARATPAETCLIEIQPIVSSIVHGLDVQ